MLQLLIHLANSPKALVGGMALLSTFVASVMANEQELRLRQGTFGAIAGTSVGAFAAIVKGKPDLVLVGIFGSACGALAGWIVYLGLAILAGVNKKTRSMVDYQIGGLPGVRPRIDLENEKQLLNALTVWSQNFRGMVMRESQVILAKH